MSIQKYPFRPDRGLDAITMHQAARAWVENKDKAAAIQVVKNHTGRGDARKALLRAFRKHGWITTQDRRTMSKQDQLKEIEALKLKAARNPNMRYIGNIDTELVWEAAYRYYLDNQSFRQLADWMQSYMPRENRESLSESLRRIWHVNEWPVRERQEAFRIRMEAGDQLRDDSARAS